MPVKSHRLIALGAAIVVAALFRLVPHPPNFTPIAAIALFAGAYLPRRALGFVVPFGALLLSDLLLGGFYDGIAFVYLAFALTVLIGWTLSSRRSALPIAAAALTSSVLFFAVSNFGTWLGSGMYPHTLGGLQACYVAAIPFFGNTLAGDLVFSALLFGSFALLERSLPAIREPRRAALA